MVLIYAENRSHEAVPSPGPVRPLDWQQPRPALHVVDLHRGRVTSSVDLPHTPNEIVANAG
jgi:hypothetical protein